MENCLVTKLKGLVNNPELKRFGYIRIKIATGSVAYNVISFTNQSLKSYVVGGTLGGNTEFTGNISTQGYQAVSDGTFDGYIYLDIPQSGIFQLGTYDFESVDATALAYSPTLVHLYFPMGFDDVDIIENKLFLEPRIQTLSINKYINGETLDITNIGKTGTLNSVDFTYTRNVKGTMNNIGLSPITSDFSAPDSMAVDFSIEQFVANQRSIGRTEYTFNGLHWFGVCNSTFNSSHIEHKENYTLSWTANTITFDSVTINA